MILLYLAVIELSFECQQTLTIIASTLVDTMVSSTPPLRDRLALLVLFYLDIIEASCAPRSSFLAPGQGRRGVFHGLHWRSAGQWEEGCIPRSPLEELTSCFSGRKRENLLE